MPDVSMNKFVDEHMAAALLGLPLPELRWFSRVLSLGHTEEIGEAERLVFTYDDLKRLSSAAATSTK
jgi:hypothetical protein